MCQACGVPASPGQVGRASLKVADLGVVDNGRSASPGQVGRASLKVLERGNLRPGLVPHPAKLVGLR